MKTTLRPDTQAFNPLDLVQKAVSYEIARPLLLEASRAYLDQQLGSIRNFHRTGASGSKVTLALTQLFDDITQQLFAAAAWKLDAASVENCALFALGGYGRCEMNPRSDLDLMFYYIDGGRDAAEKISDRMLYLLWDLGLDVGYSVRSAPDCLEQARQDITVRTAMLDTRFLAGSQTAWDGFKRSVFPHVLGDTTSKFIKAKLEENQERRRKYGSSVYLLEPNIKEGEGGLRDLHAALWTARIKFKASSLRDLVIKGVLNEEEAAAIEGAYDYLWKIRNELHFLATRKSDQVLFEHQSKIAAFLGYKDDKRAPAVEQFMQEYYTHAAHVEHLSSGLIIKATQRDESRAGVLGFFVRRNLEDGFTILRGEIRLESEERLREKPALIMKAFELAQYQGAELSVPLKLQIRDNLNLINDRVRRSKEINESFLRILRHPKGVGRTLRQMHHLHVLNHFIPEFKRIFCKVQFDLYHIYTVDIHSLFAVEETCRLWDGGYDKEYPLLAHLAKDVEKRELLLLAVLFHDIGKGEGKDHSTKGASMVPTIARRMGLNREDSARLEFLVQNHLSMVHVSQRRDLNDRRTISDFAGLMGMSENLKMLYLLTFADVRSVGPDVWSGWKGQLLQELYEKTFDLLEKGDFFQEKHSEKVRNRKRKVRAALLEDFPESRVNRCLANLSTRYLLSYHSKEIVGHLQLSLGRGKETLALQVEQHQAHNYTQVTLATLDHPGLFSQIAGVMAAHAINILGAQIHTRKNGLVLDVLKVNSSTGTAVENGSKWKRLEKDLAGVIEGRLFVDNLLKRQKAPSFMAKRDKPQRPNHIDILNDVSDKYTVIDIYTHDRIGLLYDITRTLTELGLYIAVSKISTKVDQVADVFYVRDIFGQKIVQPEKLRKIENDLLACLD
ncbi:[protein-PII] uridylyltransferase [Geopsychrobacter electrodiphilus]|uniref:[protein-PII] uridylyltransferase n=1 Tax=Geopsychrobacter electrodiphilus TaxID=225196 RepID=UPI0003734802|nr:[protein-PII] uridylyltransferase [Geopsychrobacter electrodiphilus]